MLPRLLDRLAPWFLIRPIPHPRRVAAWWTAVAVASFAMAVWVALQPGQLDDLHLVRKWLRFWLDTGTDPYQRFGAELDYPPVAFLILWPLALPSDATLAAWYLPGVAVVSVAAGWVLVQWMSEWMYIRLAPAERWALVALLLSGSGMRLSVWHGQTVALALLFGGLAMRYARRRPYLSALLLALCAFKPHVALGFALAMWLTTGANVLLLAFAMVATLSLFFAATVGHPVSVLIARYADNLIATYGGEIRVRGLLSIRHVLDDVIGLYSASTAVYLVLALGTLAALVWLARTKRIDAVSRAIITSSAVIWSVVFLPHQRYNILLVAPALWMLMWPEAGLIRRPSLRTLAVIIYVVFGVLDVPLVLRELSQHVDGLSGLWPWSYWLAPLRPAAAFGLLLYNLWRMPADRGEMEGTS